MAVETHDQEVAARVRQPRQDGVAFVKVRRGDRVGLGLDAVAGQVQGDVGARLRAVGAASALRIDDHDVDLLGRLQERHGVAHRPGRLAPAVPGERDGPADAPRRADVGHRQHRPAGRQHQVLDHVPAGGAGRVGVDLADHRQVGVAGVLGHERRHVVGRGARDAGVGLDALAVGLGRERLDGGLGRFLGAGALFGDGIAGQLRRDEAGQLRFADDIEPGQMRVVGRGEVDRRLDPAAVGFRLVDVDEKGLVGHVLRSPGLPSHCGPAAAVTARLFQAAAPPRIDLGQPARRRLETTAAPDRPPAIRLPIAPARRQDRRQSCNANTCRANT